MTDRFTLWLVVGIQGVIGICSLIVSTVLAMRGKDYAAMLTVGGTAVGSLASLLTNARTAPSPGDLPTPVRVTNSPALPIPTHETEPKP